VCSREAAGRPGEPQKRSASLVSVHLSQSLRRPSSARFSHRRLDACSDRHSGIDACRSCRAQDAVPGRATGDVSVASAARVDAGRLRSFHPGRTGPGRDDRRANRRLRIVVAARELRPQPVRRARSAAFGRRRTASPRGARPAGPAGVAEVRSPERERDRVLSGERLGAVRGTRRTQGRMDAARHAVIGRVVLSPNGQRRKLYDQARVPGELPGPACTFECGPTAPKYPYG
jgi:hypothetical protein